MSDPWRDPAPEELESAAFNAVWEVIKKWDISDERTPGLYSQATGTHVVRILDAMAGLPVPGGGE